MTECFKPLAQPSRYKAAYGGRGLGKRRPGKLITLRQKARVIKKSR